VHVESKISTGKQEITMNKFLAALIALAFFATSPGEAATSGLASYYKTGKHTANGERYLPDGLTAAHRKLPFGTRLKVTNLRNGKTVIVRVNDRGPFIKRRVLDLSYGAAKAIGLHRTGIANISFVVLD
jgi:rare lipoprotein A